MVTSGLWGFSHFRVALFVLADSESGEEREEFSRRRRVEYVEEMEKAGAAARGHRCLHVC